MSRFCIVVIGYNRIDSIRRLMGSVLNAVYDEPVDLIISIDKSGTEQVRDYAETVEWAHGNKIVRTFPERLGLRRHVLTCGSYMNEYGYDALIVLEDDLFAAPGFFGFAKQAVERYRDDDRIAGISLYTHAWNVNADRPFIPLYRGCDVFFIQCPQSWGQVWMKRQWNEFYAWYETRQYENLDSARVPGNVLGWPESSWLKYHVEYCIDRDRYFAYPYQSLTTNFADAGTHYAVSTNKMQVSLNMTTGMRYRMPQSMDESSVYDAYLENTQLAAQLDIAPGELTVDLYGKKKTHADQARYLLSTNKAPFHRVRSFGLEMRPWELNVIHGIPGEDIVLYDRRKPAAEPALKRSSLRHWIYDTRGEVLLKRNLIGIMAHEVSNKLRCMDYERKRKRKSGRK